MTASILTHSLGWALLHSLWQGALILAMLKLLLISFPGITAKVKYYMAYMSLTALFLWFTGTFLQEWQRLQAVTVKVTEGAIDAGGGKVLFIQTFPTRSSYLPEGLLNQVEKNFPLIVTLYTIGILFFSFRFAVNLLQVHRLRTIGTKMAPAFILGLVEQLKSRLEIDQKITLLLSEKVIVPIVFGVFKPIILLPVSTISQLTIDQLEAILLHELAHIKRHDFLLNIFQIVVETILFFNPFTWLISSTIRTEREHCCDDMVLDNTNQPLPYAKALATLEAHRIHAGSYALAATGHSNHLLHRIKRIMEMKKSSFNYSQLVVACILVATLGISIIWLTPAFAQNKKGREQKKEQPPTPPIPPAPPTPPSPGKIVVIDEKGKRTEYPSPEELPESIKRTIEESMTTAEAGMKSADEALKMAGDILKDIDVATISREVEKNLKDIDWAQINEQVSKSLDEIDWEQINKDIERSMSEAGLDSTHGRITPEIRAKIAAAQGQASKGAAEARKAIAEGSRQRAQGQRELARAKREMADARAGAPSAAARSGYAYAYATPTGYDRMLKEMERDGLLTRAEGFKIKKSGSTLSINGKRQSNQIYRKYSRYMKVDDITIKGDEDDLSIRIRN